MEEEIFFDGKSYASAGDAARSAGFTRDYIARLCRDGKVGGRRIGKNWYADTASLKSFLGAQRRAKTTRRESLIGERIREYQEAISDRSVVLPMALEAPRVIADRADEIKNKMALAIAGHTSDGIGQAKHLLNAPGGIAHAALQGAHIPVYTITPIMEFIHKILALAFALVLVFGTYAAFDPAYGQFAANSMRNINGYLEVQGAAAAESLWSASNTLLEGFSESRLR